MIKNSIKIILFSTIFFVMHCASVYSAGFQIYNQDAAAAGMGNSFTAVADNGSAVFYNPAGINQLEGTQLRSGFHLVALILHSEGLRAERGLIWIMTLLCF